MLLSGMNDSTHNPVLRKSDDTTKHFLDVLKSRKLLRQSSTTNLPDDLCIYIGFDPTGISLHIGHLVCMRILSIAKELGHKTMCLIGSGTALLGDPTWKTETRPMLNKDDIAKNAYSIKKQLSSIANPDHIVDNSEWLQNMNILEFMRSVAAYFSVNQLVGIETFYERLSKNKHLSFMEFTYPLLQGYDFLYLNQKYGCNVQLGGSDQWGNITQGISFVNRVINETVNSGRLNKEKEVFGITNELLTKSGGEKMGKSISGSVYLDENLVSPYDFWQFWRNTADEDVSRLMLQLTNLTEDEIDNSVVDMNNAKKTLADHITTWVHGKDKALDARRKSESLYEQNLYDSIEVHNVVSGLTLEKVLVEIDLAKSFGDAKRMIQAGSVQVNDQKALDPNYVLNEGEYVLCYGKKKYLKLKASISI